MFLLYCCLCGVINDDDDDSPGGLRDGSPPLGSRGEAPVGVWGEAPQKLKQFADSLQILTAETIKI